MSLEGLHESDFNLKSEKENKLENYLLEKLSLYLGTSNECADLAGAIGNQGLETQATIVINGLTKILKDDKGRDDDGRIRSQAEINKILTDNKTGTNGILQMALHLLGFYGMKKDDKNDKIDTFKGDLMNKAIIDFVKPIGQKDSTISPKFLESMIGKLEFERDNIKTEDKMKKVDSNQIKKDEIVYFQGNKEVTENLNFTDKRLQNVIKEVREKQPMYDNFFLYCGEHNPKIKVGNVELDFSNPTKYISFTQGILSLQKKRENNKDGRASDRNEVLKEYAIYCNEYIKLEDKFDKIYMIRDDKRDKEKKGFQNSSWTYMEEVYQKYSQKQGFEINFFGDYSTYKQSKNSDKPRIAEVQSKLKNIVPKETEDTPSIIISKLTEELKNEQSKVISDKNYKPKRILFDLGLHGGEGGSAGFTKGNFTKTDFEKIFALAKQYPNLTININSCYSGNKTSSEVEGNVIMSSSKQTTSKALDEQLVRGFYRGDLNGDKSVSLYEATFYSAMNYTDSLVPISFVRSNGESVQLCGIK